ncbi:PP2C family protein-serine/threonine phosphatase [Streptomyces sp. KLOTTS4A1]|uniref:PP2C family protein-serine/threonine phosphatase n=1 Tax=Streptomyces sp. KLOTTS4A1 TaxID=3390996 RepID=UPI0039F44821
MIRITARAPFRARPGQRAAASQPSRIRRMTALALPTLWGGAAILYKLACPFAQQNGLAARIATSAVFFTVGTGLVIGARRALVRELAQLREVAGAAQRVLLRPPPPRLDGLALAAGQLCAHRSASIGGDLYEAIATDHGVRIVMGDVRGHGLAAIGTVAALLGSFREAAHDEAELTSVLRRLERTMQRHLSERARSEHPAACAGEPERPTAEEFVTVLLLEIRPDGTVHALNCGHPWPFRLGGAASLPSAARGPAHPEGPPAERIATGEPLPPLGPFPLPEELPVQHCGRLLGGETLVLYTDGVEDARDPKGRFFPLEAVLAGHRGAPGEVIEGVREALLRHTGGRFTDDMALLAVRNERSRVPRRPGEPVGRGTRAVT